MVVYSKLFSSNTLIMMKPYFILLLMFPLIALASTEKPLMPPEDPRQSITYWKSHAIAATEDGDVKLAQSIFSRLLQVWDHSRVEPGLYVVRSDGAAWAASLADGNILLSREAIDASFRFGRQRGEHLLAFVLAHELAHQRSDDLWHQRFFRSMRKQDKKNRELLLNGLALEADTIADIEQKEVQADHDGLIMMSVVGFDPWQVLADKDFFTAWVESIWQEACDSSMSEIFLTACQQAQSRALRTRSQLDTVASQSALYDLGIQAMVANQYQQARHFFTLFGREYPNRNVMSAIGISYLGEALVLRHQLAELGAIDQVDFYFPLMLDASAGVPNQAEIRSQKRANDQAQVGLLRQRMVASLKSATQFLQKAIKLDQQHRFSYLSLAMVHMLENNPYLVRGVLQGRYIPRFGKDASVSLLLAMVNILQGEFDLAEQLLKTLLSEQMTISREEAIPADLLNYSAAYNLSALYQYRGQSDKKKKLWYSLAQRQKSSGNAVLFRLALKNLEVSSGSGRPTIDEAPTIKGVRLGDRKPRDDAPHQVSELWIEGEQYHVYSYHDGTRYISASNGKVVSASQIGGEASINGKIAIGDSADRPLKILGLPDRRLHLSSGDYIAYDDYRLALQIIDNRVHGWFLYQ